MYINNQKYQILVLENLYLTEFHFNAYTYKYTYFNDTWYMYKNVHVSYLLMLKKSEQLLFKFKASMWFIWSLHGDSKRLQSDKTIVELLVMRSFSEGCDIDRYWPLYWGWGDWWPSSHSDTHTIACRPPLASY